MITSLSKSLLGSNYKYRLYLVYIDGTFTDALLQWLAVSIRPRSKRRVARSLFCALTAQDTNSVEMNQTVMFSRSTE